MSCRFRIIKYGIQITNHKLQKSAFRIPNAEFKCQIDDWIRTFRNTKPAAGTDGPIIPGDPEREAEAERKEAGIPLIAAVLEDLRQVSRMTGVPFD